MTDTTDTENFTDLEPPKKKGKGRVLVFLLLFLLVLGGGASYIYFFNPGLVGLENTAGNTGAVTSSASGAAGDSAEVQTYDNIIPLEEIIINIRDRDFQRLFKLSISLELVDVEDNPTVMQNLPVLLDSFQSHLRGLRISEIEGSRAIYRIKEELIARANIVLHPVRVKNILFAELLIQ